jgi:threonine/homoserine/homoserine lactone efflux protein
MGGGIIPAGKAASLPALVCWITAHIGKRRLETAGFWPGLILGFSIAAPVGPIGVLCIRRTLAQGRLAGLLTGLGAATADAIYGSIAAFGLTAATSFLLGQGHWLRPAGALLLGYLGFRTVLSRPTADVPRGASSGALQAYLTSLGLTLTNPMTIFSFGAAYAGLGLGTRSVDPLAAAWMVGGVFLGSVLWWATLTMAVGWLRTRLGWNSMLWINRGSGALLLVFAAVLMVGELA